MVYATVEVDRLNASAMPALFPPEDPTRDPTSQINEMVDAAQAHTVPSSAGTPVLWRRFGSGKPLVLMHGGHGDWMHWFRNVAALATIREVWIPDLPSFGDSADVQPSTFAQLCDVTRTSLDALLGPSTAIDLAGFSFGGMVAASLAGRRPVARLVLAGSGGHGAPGRVHSPLLNWHKTAQASERIAMMNANVRTFMFHDATAATPLVEAIYARQCLRTRFRSRGSWGNATLQGFLKAAQTETLLLWGDQDVTLAAPDAYSVALHDAQIPHTFTLVPGAGHWLQCEAPDTVNAAMTAFLEKTALR